MSIFTDKLALTIIYRDENGQDFKMQGQFLQIAKSLVYIYFPVQDNRLQPGVKVKVQFFAKQFEFEFDSEVKGYDKKVLMVVKPQTVNRRKQRLTQRIDVEIPVTFTLWTETGQYEGSIINLSSIGCKLLSDVSLSQNQVITVSTFISKNNHQIRLITQATVIWTERYDDTSNQFVSGIKFTTISNDNIKKLDSYIRSLSLQGSSDKEQAKKIGFDESKYGKL